MPIRPDSVDASGIWDPRRPYQDLPDLPPASELETPTTLRACISARAALGELKQAVEQIPNPALLIGSLPILEAQASSEIENIVTTADELFRHAEDTAGASPASKEALRYREALLEGHRALGQRPLGTRVAEKICSRIKGVEMSVRKVPGTALGNAATGEVVYTPPEAEVRLRDLLARWESFLHEQDEVDPLIRMAAAHYQFEAIHPFTDGNGRTGRVINSLYLIERGLLGAPILYLSGYIVRNKEEYYERLLRVTRDRSWEPWILYLLEGVTETAIWTLNKISAIRALLDATRAHVQAHLPKIYSAELIQLLFERPYCRIAHLSAAGIAKRETASRYLKELVRVGVLTSEIRGRDKIFVNVRFLTLLTREGDAFREFAPAPQ